MSYIKIYFGNKPVYLCDTLTPELNLIKDSADTIFIDNLSNYKLQQLSREIEKPEHKQGLIYFKDFTALKKAFFSHFLVIKAGGGLIQNKKEEILLIFRRGKWDLPKGKLDDNESIEECALREVREETGLNEIKLGNKISITYHSYVERGTLILKESHWYAMESIGNEMLVPQTEEGISEIIWVKKEDLEKYTSNIFPALIDVLNLV